MYAQNRCSVLVRYILVVKICFVVSNSPKYSSLGTTYVDAAPSVADQSNVDFTLNDRCVRRIAFGSCNKATEDQPLWNPLKKFDPQVFLWTGDSIYLSNRFAKNATALEKQFTKQKQVPDYESFAKGRIVEGVWDDHDYAENDAGRISETKRRSRIRTYLEFLSVPPGHARYARDGLYSSHRFRICCDDTNESTSSCERSGNGFLRVIFLDTRSHRDDHFIPSIGGVKWIPAAAIVAAMGRWICAALGLGATYAGDVLGDEQSRWLEAQLADAARLNDSATVIVSSVQVLTTNPIVESWGHFPDAKRALLRILKAFDLRGLVLLSGDVHHAEILTDGAGLLEMTSSGMTHTCTMPWFGFFCRWMLRAFPSHREMNEIAEAIAATNATSEYDATTPSTFTGLNFGTLTFDLAAGRVAVGVRDVNNRVRLLATRAMSSADKQSKQHRDGVESERGVYTAASLHALVRFFARAILVVLGLAALAYASRSATRPSSRMQHRTTAR